MNTYLTEIEAIDPADGELRLWSGPRVQAISPGLARQWLDLNGYGYCKIIGELIAEMDEGWKEAPSRDN